MLGTINVEFNEFHMFLSKGFGKVRERKKKK
jgi:hypothetical protein